MTADTLPDLPADIATILYDQNAFSDLPRPVHEPCGLRVGLRPKRASEPGEPFRVRVVAMFCTECGVNRDLTV